MKDIWRSLSPAIHGYTAAEEIYDRANVKSDFVGPTTGKILLRRKRQLTLCIRMVKKNPRT